MELIRRKPICKYAELKKKIGFLPLLFLSFNTYATTYYVSDCGPRADADCVTGNDSNNGKSATTPWKTIDKVEKKWKKLRPGDHVLIAKGAHLQTSQTITLLHPKSTDADRITIDSYVPPWANGDEKRPIVEKTTNGNLFSMDGPDFKVEEGINIKNLHLVCSACLEKGGGYGVVFHDAFKGATVEGNIIDGFRVNVGMGSKGGSSTNILIRNNEIRNGKRQGIQGQCDNSVIEGNYIHHNGRKSSLDHGIYLSRSENCLVQNNELFENADGGTNFCSGTQITVHGTSNDITFKGNLVHNRRGNAESQCHGIDLGSGYSDSETLTRMHVMGNTIVNFGFKAIATSSCIECTISNNLVIQDHIPNFEAGQKAIDGSAKNNIADNDSPDEKVSIQNNTVIFTASANPSPISGSTGIEMNATNKASEGHIVTNNIVVFENNVTRNTCFNYDGMNLSSDFLEIDNNACEFGAGNWSDAYSTLASFQAATPWDDHSKEATLTFNDETLSGSLTAPNSGTGPNNWNLATADFDHDDPDLVDQGNSDINISGSGRSGFTPVGYNGIAREKPDIGAFESSGAP